LVEPVAQTIPSLYLKLHLPLGVALDPIQRGSVLLVRPNNLYFSNLQQKEFHDQVSVEHIHIEQSVHS
jgi:hypothetical protein